MWAVSPDNLAKSLLEKFSIGAAIAFPLNPRPLFGVLLKTLIFRGSRSHF